MTRLGDREVAFDALYRALRAAPGFLSDVPIGRLDRARVGRDGLEFERKLGDLDPDR